MKPRIVVIGVGGAGGNAINNMISSGLAGAEFIVANTDAQALEASGTERRIQLGSALTEGLGAGSKPEIGEAAAVEAIEDIRSAVSGAHILFIAAGMGGGTGTGAASVIARVAKEFGILTVAVVTKPFQFEGSRRMRVAEIGIAELRHHVDTLLVIPNQNLFRIATDRTTFAEAFVLADQVLYSGIACIVDLIVKEGLINLDLADVKTVLSGMGTAMMGTGEASGEQRAIVASEEAIVNPLLDDTSLKGARSLLLSITGGRDLTLWEVDEAANRVRQEVDPEANIIVGATFDETLGDKVRVSIVASGMGRAQPQSHRGQADAWAPRGAVPPPPPQSPVSGADYQLQLREAIDNGAYAASDSGRRAPGDVYIKEGPPHLGPASSGPLAGGGRPSLNVQDFPPHAQREYWAKTAEGGHRGSAQPPSVYQRQPEPPPVKTSLLRRLAGAGRGARAAGRDEQLQKHQQSKSDARPPEEAIDLPVFFGRGKR
ncbi:MAG: cell division protein FtsZ [Hyphomicrobiaceae bacterium]